MALHAIAFYLMAAVTVAAGFCVVSARNPVHSVLWLILAFFSAAGLFVLMGAEFLAMLLVVVYVGAVAVLFLFVVMMLDVDFVELRQGFLQYLPVGALVGIIFLVELVLVAGTWATSPGMMKAKDAPVVSAEQLTNTEAIGQVLYTTYIHYFQLAGIVLLVAMIGAIVLTLRAREGVRRQQIARQVGRSVEDSVEIKKVETGKGI